MYLSDEEYKLMQALATKVKAGTATEEEKAQYQELVAKKQSKDDGSHDNDASWYNKFPSLFQVAGELAYQYFNGDSLRIARRDITLPGLAKIVYTPTIGRCLNSHDPAAVIFNNLFTNIGYKSGSSIPFEYPDFAIEQVCIMSMYLYIAWLERIYGVANTYSVKNQFLPRRILSAMGVSFDSDRKHLADFVYGINNLILEVNTLIAPKDWSFWQRNLYLLGNIFKDGNNDNAFTFFYEPSGFYMWCPKTSTHGSAAVCVHPSDIVTGQLLTYEDLLNFGLDMVARLKDDQDVRIINTWFLKAFQKKDGFGMDKLITSKPCPPGFTMFPGYSKEHMMQFHNTFFNGKVAPVLTSDLLNASINTNLGNLALKLAHGVIGQYDGEIYQDFTSVENIASASQPSWATLNYSTLVTTIPLSGKVIAFDYSTPYVADVFYTTRDDKFILDCTEDEDSKDLNIVGTRNVVLPHTYYEKDTSASSIKGVVCNMFACYGTEIFESMTIYTISGQLGVINSTFDTTYTALRNKEQIDWSPIMYFGARTAMNNLINGVPPQAPAQYVLSDIYNPALIGEYELKKLHRCAIYSEFKLDFIPIKLEE